MVVTSVFLLVSGGIVGMALYIKFVMHPKRYDSEMICTLKVFTYNYYT